MWDTGFIEISEFVCAKLKSGEVILMLVVSGALGTFTNSDTCVLN